MFDSFTRYQLRKSFARIPEITEMPDLIEVQFQSYEQFLQMNTPAEQRINAGLQGIFKTLFPIKEPSGRVELDFVSYSLDLPKYDVKECYQRDMTYSAALKISLQLKLFDTSHQPPIIKQVKEETAYLGDIPLMTPNGTFIVNGTERVVVSQMHRSPGVLFDYNKGQVFSAHVIPYRGSWIDFEFDSKDCIYFRIDRRRKLPVTTLLYALDTPQTEELRKHVLIPHPDEAPGLSQEDILSFFYKRIAYKKTAKGWIVPFEKERIQKQTLSEDLIDAHTGQIWLTAGTTLTIRMAQKLFDQGLRTQLVSADSLIGQYLACDLVNEETGEVYAEAGDGISESLLKTLDSQKINDIQILSDPLQSPYILNTMMSDRNTNRLEALQDIYRVMRPGDPLLTYETADSLFHGLFFDGERYDLSAVGRMKMNARLGLQSGDEVRVLRPIDILTIIKTLITLREGHGEIDDIDHLGNRRVRSVGELVENQFRIGFFRMERVLRERISTSDYENLMPQDLINAKPITAAIRELFGSSQLSQFMDQVNPLSEITHKRRLSALGTGGLTRERAGFQVRDVHPTHYGRICPIETPEGQNIGLISSLACYARINQYGFIETPYRRVSQGVVTDDVVYLSAILEDTFVIAQADEPLDNKNHFQNELINCRYSGEYRLFRVQDIEYIDISPKQIVSVAAALIPFLENDDANRALMGSNMQRQAVPLMQVEAPLIGTGMEYKVAQDGRGAVIAKRSGIVDQVDAMRIVVRAHEVDDHASAVDIYRFKKFQRSNQNTCINQKPLARVGQQVHKGDILADGTCTSQGELALGRNILVAFMPWLGYNFEDSIVISERLVRDEVFTSIHIEEFEIMARDSKLGPEEITRDIPNLSEESLKNLDESGIVCVGAKVKPGDILVGRVTPKGESPMTAEEKLLRAIFGEKVSDVKDTSLKVPSGVIGTVIEVRVMSRQGIEKDARTQLIEQDILKNLTKDKQDERNILQRNYKQRLEDLFLGQKTAHDIHNLEEGTVLTSEHLKPLSFFKLRQISILNDKVTKKIEAHIQQFDFATQQLENQFQENLEKLQSGDELPPGILKNVKVFIAVKRQLQPGDKMAGRHGNKGVVSKIIPIEDMPYLENGEVIDIVLNPLSIPSRMNVGQVLETHLGWISAELGKQVHEISEQYHMTQEKSQKAAVKRKLQQKLKSIYGKQTYQKLFTRLSDEGYMRCCEILRDGIPFATPVFDGALKEDFEHLFHLADLPSHGQVTLIDGRTGEPMDRPVTVGYIYMMKLDHLVDNKIHARSTGPYSLVTQQPLGGKASFGGQRFGEMEVWALEAYGAAFTLQEMLTVKSDDVPGRVKTYEMLVRGSENIQGNTPESFNVLMKELKALGLNIEVRERRS